MLKQLRFNLGELAANTTNSSSSIEILDELHMQATKSITVETLTDSTILNVSSSIPSLYCILQGKMSFFNVKTNQKEECPAYSAEPLHSLSTGCNNIHY